MKFKISKKWCIASAKKEGNACVGAGLPSVLGLSRISAPSKRVGSGRLVGLGKRAQRRKTLLILARNLWYLKLDGIVPNNAWTMNEIDKLLRRAGATRADL